MSKYRERGGDAIVEATKVTSRMTIVSMPSGRKVVGQPGDWMIIGEDNKPMFWSDAGFRENYDAI